MNITFQFDNEKDVVDVIDLIRSHWPQLLSGAPAVIQPLQPFPADQSEDVPIDVPEPEVLQTQTPEPLQTQKPEPINAAPKPAAAAVSRDEIQQTVLAFFGRFAAKEDQLKHRTAIMTAIKEDLGADSLASVPEDKLTEAFDVVKGYIEAVA